MLGVVLGSGGVTGTAWTIGVLAGLARAAGLDVRAAALVVGTSAGSVAGARACAGHDPDEMVEGERAAEPSGPPGMFSSVDPAAVQDVFTRWASTEHMTTLVARAIAARAQAGAPFPPSEWLTRIRFDLHGATWSNNISITGVDVATGERRIWSAPDGVDLVHAVAASTAVPSLVPPIPVGNSTYVDGGVWSCTHADLMVHPGVERVLILAPQAGAGPLVDFTRRALAREVEALHAAGRRVEVIEPGPPYLRFAESLMRNSSRPEAVQAGLDDARDAAERVRALLA